jgi:hypothetical protein
MANGELEKCGCELVSARLHKTTVLGNEKKTQRFNCSGFAAIYRRSA